MQVAGGLPLGVGGRGGGVMDGAAPVGEGQPDQLVGGEAPRCLWSAGAQPQLADVCAQ